MFPADSEAIVPAAKAAAAAATADDATEELSQAGRQLHEHRNDTNGTGQGRVQWPVSCERQELRGLVHGRRCSTASVCGQEHRPTVSVVWHTPDAHHHRMGRPMGGERVQVALGQKVASHRGRRFISSGNVVQGLLSLSIYIGADVDCGV